MTETRSGYSIEQIHDAAAEADADEGRAAEPSEGKSLGRYLRDSRWSLITKGWAAIAMTTNLAILATQLGAEDFGRYAGVAALVAILAGMARFGASDLMLQSSADGDAEAIRRGWGRATGSTVAAMIAATGLVALLRPVLLPGIPLLFVVALALGEYLFVTAVDVEQRFMHMLGAFRRAAIFVVSALTIRVAVLSTLLFWPISDLGDLGVRYFFSGLGAWLLGVLMTARWHRWARWSMPTSTEEIQQRLSIAVGQTSTTIATRIDQTLLLRAGFVADTAIYSIGARIVFNAMMPAAALMEVSYPDFFRAGAKGKYAVGRVVRRLAKPLLAYGVFAAVVLIALGPMVEMLLDESYDNVQWVIISMAGFPIVRIVQNLLGDMLTGLGHHHERSRAALGASLANVALNLVLIPLYGWVGAAIATYLAEGFLLIALVEALRRAPDEPSRSVTDTGAAADTPSVTNRAQN